MKSKGKIILIVFIFIAVIFGIGALMKGKSSTKPSITFEDSELVLNPGSNENTTEGYVIEYASGDNLGRNIDITIKWNNGAGFSQNKVNAIIIKRKVGSDYKKIIDKGTTTEIKLTDSKYLSDFSKSEYTIYGKFLGDNSNIVGDNIIEIYYTTSTNNTPVLLGSTIITIEQNHLDTTVDLRSVQIINIPPTSGGDINAILGLKEFTTYDIISHGRKKVLVNAVRMEQLSDGYVKLKNADGDEINLHGYSKGTTYKFEKYLETYFLIQPKGSSKYIIDEPISREYIDEHSLVEKTKDEIFKSSDNLDKALFTITPTKLPKARYVWVGKMKDVPNSQRKTDLMEVMIHDKNGINVAKGIKPESKPGFNAYEGHGVNITNISDGNYETPWFIASDRTSDNNEGQQGWIKFDLGTEKELKDVTLVIRKLYESRMEGVGIKLFDNDDNEIMSTTMLTTEKAKKSQFISYNFLFGIWEPSKGPGGSYYTPKVRKTPTGGYPSAKLQDYMSAMACETACSADTSCYAAMYTDTVNSSANDNACWHYGKPSGTPTWGDHSHYSTLVKQPFDFGVYPNPKFVDGKPIIDGTPWGDTNKNHWETFSSASAHGTIYLSWHPFSYDSSKVFAAYKGQDKPYVGISYPRPVILKGFTIESKSDNNNYIPDKLVVEGSNDGMNWTEIKETTTPSGVVGYSKNKLAIIARETLTNDKAYRVFRVRVTSDNRATVYNNIGEIRLFTTLGDTKYTYNEGPSLEYDDWIQMYCEAKDNGVYFRVDTRSGAVPWIEGTPHKHEASPIFLKKNSKNKYQLVFKSPSAWVMLVWNAGLNGYGLLPHGNTHFEWEFIRKPGTIDRYWLVNTVTKQMLWPQKGTLGYYAFWEDPTTLFTIKNVIPRDGKSGWGYTKGAVYGCLSPDKPTIGCNNSEGVGVGIDDATCNYMYCY
jgi:hypothetical protein